MSAIPEAEEIYREAFDRAIAATRHFERHEATEAAHREALRAVVAAVSGSRVLTTAERPAWAGEPPKRSAPGHEAVYDEDEIAPDLDVKEHG